MRVKTGIIAPIAASSPSSKAITRFDGLGGFESRVAFKTHLSCDVPKDEQSACNRSHVLGSRHGEIWRMNLGDD